MAYFYWLSLGRNLESVDFLRKEFHSIEQWKDRYYRGQKCFLFNPTVQAIQRPGLQPCLPRPGLWAGNRWRRSRRSS